MVRRIKVLSVAIYMEEVNMLPKTKKDIDFISFLEKKYQTVFQWEIEDDEVIYLTKEVETGDVDTNINMLLEIAKEYNYKMSGTFHYIDDTNGGSLSGIAYVAYDYTALIQEFDNDINILKLSDSLKFLNQRSQRILNPFDIPTVLDENQLKIGDRVMIETRDNIFNYIITKLVKNRMDFLIEISVCSSSDPSVTCKLIKKYDLEGDKWVVLGLIENHDVKFV
jgi:hypothetical protein